MVKYSFDIPKDIEVITIYASKHLSISSICVVTYVTDMYDMLNAIVQQQTIGYDLKSIQKKVWPQSGPKRRAWLSNTRIHVARGKKVKKHTK